VTPLSHQQNLLLPLFDISKGEKRNVLDGMLVVSSCAIVWVALQKRGETELRDLYCAIRVPRSNGLNDACAAALAVIQSGVIFVAFLFSGTGATGVFWVAVESVCPTVE
jgi:hypothetical protein